MSRLDTWSQSSSFSCQYPDDADILMHIQWLWKEIPGITHVRRWVKAHQDSDTPYADLPWNARLNVMADSLATAYYNTMTRQNKTVSNSHFYPSSRVSLLVDGQRTTANLAAAIRFHISGTTHRRFLQQTEKGWQSDLVWRSL